MNNCIKVEYIKTFNWQSTLRGMRNPMESWDKSDSDFYYSDSLQQELPVIGEADYNLCKKLINAGSDHRKFLRQIFISFDLTTSLYYWKQFDQYKIGTVTNSTSTMHCIHKQELTIDNFAVDSFDDKLIIYFNDIINELNQIRNRYIDTKDKTYWRQLIQLLPSSYLQMRTVSMNYEVLHNIYHARKNHKLYEWQFMLNDILKNIPYPEFIDGNF